MNQLKDAVRWLQSLEEDDPLFLEYKDGIQGFKSMDEVEDQVEEPGEVRTKLIKELYSYHFRRERKVPKDPKGHLITGSTTSTAIRKVKASPWNPSPKQLTTKTSRGSSTLFLFTHRMEKSVCMDKEEKPVRSHNEYKVDPWTWEIEAERRKPNLQFYGVKHRGREDHIALSKIIFRVEADRMLQSCIELEFSAKTCSKRKNDLIKSDIWSIIKEKTELPANKFYFNKDFHEEVLTDFNAHIRAKAEGELNLIRDGLRKRLKRSIKAELYGNNIKDWDIKLKTARNILWKIMTRKELKEYAQVLEAFRYARGKSNKEWSFLDELVIRLARDKNLV